MTTYANMSEYRQAHAKAGGHFFDRKTMRFWESRIESGLLKGGYFITTDKLGDDDERLYTVRQINPADPINITTHNRHKTRAEAMHEITELRARAAAL